MPEVNTIPNHPATPERSQSAVDVVTHLAQRGQELFDSGHNLRGALIKALRDECEADNVPVSQTLLCEVAQLVIDTQAVTV